MSTNIDKLHDDHHHTPTGIMRWITTTNHKDIGSMYLWFSLIIPAWTSIGCTRVFQSNDNHACSSNDFWCCNACFCWISQLAITYHDWCS